MQNSQKKPEKGVMLEALPKNYDNISDKVPESDESASGSSPKKFALLGILIVAAVVGGYFAYQYWTVGRFIEKTDDAYIQADIAEISPKIQGYVNSILVTENQQVKAGDVLFKLDDGDYQIALKTAKSKAVTQQQVVKRIEAQIVAAQASVRAAISQKEAADAAAGNAKRNAERLDHLADSKTASRSQLDDAMAGYDQARAEADGAQAQIESAKANVDVLKAQLAEARSQLGEMQLGIDQAKRDLALANLRAPFDGTVANISAELGNLVSPGAHVASIVPDNALYVEAYFKETQVKGIVEGSKAKITFDALPDREFEAVVTSTSPATGAVFSLLPPENATGNFTKVVQRVPVRIDIPEAAYKAVKLKVGLSVIVHVDERTGMFRK